MSFLNDTKHWVRDLFRYPTYRPADASYDQYWERRDMGSLNAFQKARADLLLQKLGEQDSVLDLGCGDGRILAYLKSKKPNLELSGLDSSATALELARQRGLNVRQADLHDLNSLGEVGADYILLFEVLEHLAESEKLLAWAVAHARKAVVFSVPNTGFVIHRLRLLLGRFPLQYSGGYPGEHLRFWTVRDMHWWLKSLGYQAEIYNYQGVPIFNKLWPALFAEGILVFVKPKNG